MPQEQPWENYLFFRCSRSRVTVLDMADVRFHVRLSRSCINFISIVAVFSSLFSGTEGKTGVEPVQTSLKEHVTLKQICMEAGKHKLTTPKRKHIYNWQALACCTMPSMWVLLPFVAVPAYGIAFTSKAELRAAVVAWEANTERLPWDLQNDTLFANVIQTCVLQLILFCNIQMMSTVSSCLSFWSWHMLSNRLGVL